MPAAALLLFSPSEFRSDFLPPDSACERGSGFQRDRLIIYGLQLGLWGLFAGVDFGGFVAGRGWMFNAG